MKIVEFSGRNILGCRFAEIRPDGQVVVIGGLNGNGKTSVLDAIWMILGGRDAIPEKPVRDGAETAEGMVDLGEFVVTRRWSRSGGTSLHVRTKEGVEVSKPQTFLDSLCTSLAFDPLAFGRMKAAEQAEHLRKSIGLETTDLDKAHDAYFAERAEANRELKGAKARLDKAAPFAPNVPEQEVSSAQVLERLNAVNAVNDANRKARQDFETRARRLNEMAAELDAKKEQAEALRIQLQLLTKEIGELEPVISEQQPKAEAKKKEIAALKDVDVAPIAAEMGNLDQTNKLVRANAARRELEAEHQAAAERHAGLDKRIEEIKAARLKRIAEAQYPVEGLSLADGTVTYRGLPFGQLSTAQQIGVSFAIAASANPKLRIALIRNGNDLDAKHREVLEQRAVEYDFQVWMERMSEAGGADVVMVDGEAVPNPDHLPIAELQGAGA